MSLESRLPDSDESERDTPLGLQVVVGQELVLLVRLLVLLLLLLLGPAAAAAAVLLGWSSSVSTILAPDVLTWTVVREKGRYLSSIVCGLEL